MLFHTFPAPDIKGALTYFGSVVYLEAFGSLLDCPHKGLPEKAFLKYLLCLAPHCHTSNLNVPPYTTQAVTLEFLRS